MIESKTLHNLQAPDRRRAILEKYIKSHRIKSHPDADLADPKRPLSVVIPAYNEAQNIAKTIDSIIASSTSSGDLAEIIVVDNASTDNTPHIVKDYRNHSTPVRLLPNGIKGIAPTRKTGMDAVAEAHHSKGLADFVARYIIMTDGDTTVPEGWLGAIFNQFKTSNSDMVTGVYEYPTWVDEQIYIKTGLALFFKKLSLLSLFLMEQGCSVVPTIGSNSGIEVVSYAAVGGVNQYLPRGEDHNLGEKVNQKNGLISTISTAVQTSPRRALEAMLKKVDFATLNTNWTDVRGSDQELLKLVLNEHSKESFKDQKLLREGYIIFGRVVLPILTGKLDSGPLIEFLGNDHSFVKELKLLIEEKSKDEYRSGAWSREKTEKIAKDFSFLHASSVVSYCELMEGFKNLFLTKNLSSVFA